MSIYSIFPLLGLLITLTPTNSAPPPPLSPTPSKLALNPKDIILPLRTTTSASTSVTPTFLSSSAPKYNWNKEEYPNPQQNPKFCQRAEKSLLCDPDLILTVDEANKLDQLIEQASNTTKCYCQVCPEGGGGIKLGIALAQNIYKGYNAPIESASQEFANYIRHRWQYGTCDNSVLILFVSSQVEITFSIGITAQQILTDEFFQNLVKQHGADFEQGQFFKGLRSIIGGIRTLVHSNKAPTNISAEEAERKRAAAGGGGAGGEANNATPTAIAIVGIICGFFLVIFVLTGTIILAKKRYEVEEDSGLDPDQQPGFNGDDGEDDGSRPPLPPATTPPSTPTTNGGAASTRKVSTRKGTLEYEPVSIIEDEVARKPATLNRERNPESATRPEGEVVVGVAKAEVDTVGHLHGEEEILDQSSRISTPDLNDSRL